MLNDVPFGAFLEQPAGKDARPLIIAVFEHDKLHERAGFLRRFPLRRPFTGAQPHDRSTDPDTFTRFQRDVAHKAVALVEQPEDRHPLLHRRHPGKGVVAASQSGLGNRAVVVRRRWRFSAAIAAS